MWILTPQQPGGETHYLLSGEEYTVGRKNCEILLLNDLSISRVHARFVATEQILNVMDLSKYGTSVNNQLLSPNTLKRLESGDSITFGVFHSKFSVDHQQPVVCSSCMDVAGKAALSQALQSLGVKLLNSWSPDCTHLVMPAVKLTIKTITALLSCRPIVKPEYFSEFCTAVQQHMAPPSVERFLPEIDEPSLSTKDVNLTPLPARKHLFTGKTFVFLSAKQLNRLATVVSCGGGSSRLLDEGSLPVNLLESPQSCVICLSSGSSQNLPPSSPAEWEMSVKSIVQRKGLRLITESEIGMAAIFASCDKYCNPSCVTSEPAAKVRVPNSSMSQPMEVNETMLPAVSQNITAYAVNTEPSQEMKVCKEAGITTVGETPEKRPDRCDTGHTTQKMSSQFIVADTLQSTVDTQLTEPKPRGGAAKELHLVFTKNSDGVKFVQKKSPQKFKNTQQTLPQNQSSLTNFFQPVNKKRPLGDDLSPVMSEPKRPVLESSSNTHRAGVSSQSEPGVTSDQPLSSAADPYTEPVCRKRKDMEEEIQVEDLESIMSQAFDDFDDEPPVSQTARGQVSPEPTANASRKRQRLLPEEEMDTNVTVKEPEKKIPKFKEEEQSFLIRAEPLQQKKPRDSLPTVSGQESEQASSMKTPKPLKDVPLLNEWKEEGQLPAPIKQEANKTNADEDLPKQLILVEFRTLTVNPLPKTKAQKQQSLGGTKNFKCFRKACVPGTKSSVSIIRGPGLQVHNRGKNTDVDEWLKDAAEVERQTQLEEHAGDDLFRYNPTKLTKRR
ncbi:nibrin isoform X1 [Synchiropus splendidus]|uniref:nibrin isoform X1 n=1 Tax=Synchiropus splendidus TaxID=270530 RepID=UPI00237D52A9|nr:nibrin isoform X1 [Synchiropus splendidus]